MLLSLWAHVSSYGTRDREPRMSTERERHVSPIGLWTYFTVMYTIVPLSNWRCISPIGLWTYSTVICTIVPLSNWRCISPIGDALSCPNLISNHKCCLPTVVLLYLLAAALCVMPYRCRTYYNKVGKVS